MSAPTGPKGGTPAFDGGARTYLEEPGLKRAKMLIRLGATSVELTAIGQGTTQTGSYAERSGERDRQRIEVLRWGVELGMNFIDTAQLYGGGHAEEVVGEAIQGIRDRVFLAGKFNPENSTYQGVMQAVEGSLKRLRTDYLDLYQVHYPNPQVPFEETFEAMRALVEQGKVRHIGVSNFTPQELRAAKSLDVPANIVSNQVEYNLFQRDIEHDMMPYCLVNQVTLIAYSPLDRGSAFKDGPRLKLLRSFAAKYEKTVTQITLRWVLSRPPIIALVKSASRQHTLENAEAMEFDLLDEDVAQIDRLFEQKIIHVPPARIRTKRPGSEGFYGSVHEALQNRLDLIPSPESVARNIEEGNFPKPVPVIPTTDISGTYDYDLLDNQIIYWAWIIAKGMNKPIPAFDKRA